MPADAAIGVLHPGAMGSVVGRALVERGRRVLWCSESRSEASAARAQACGLLDAGSLDSLVAQCEILFSVIPPHAAEATARHVADAGFGGVYVDANAIAPSTARRVRAIAQASGARYIDGSIIGGPPKEIGQTRLYLSGADAESVAAMFEHSLFSARVIGGVDQPMAASALKMCYAAFSKGTTALLANIQRLARAEGVADELLSEWDDDLPRLLEWAALADRRPHPKAWRYIGEMREIARAFGDRDLPPGFHDAAAEVYEAMSREPAE